MSYKIKGNDLAEWLNETPYRLHGSIDRAMYSVKIDKTNKANTYISYRYSIVKVQIFKSKLLQVMYA